jgi:type IV pilus assembly protein PilX
MNTSLATKHRQTGSVLIVSLIMLLILTVIGVTSITNIGTNEKMAGNYKDHDLAFQAAEAALAAGEERAESIAGILMAAENDTNKDKITSYFSCTAANSNCFTNVCLEGLCFTGTFPAPSTGGSTAGICTPGGAANKLWKIPATWTTATRAASYNTPLVGIAEDPKYIIEFMCYTLENPEIPASTTPPTYGTDWAYMFRITALGTGSSLNSRAMVQSTYKVER